MLIQPPKLRAVKIRDTFKWLGTVFLGSAKQKLIVLIFAKNTTNTLNSG
jgi:hypothetical protein